MAMAQQQKIRSILLDLLPEDHSPVDNITLLEQFTGAARDAGLNSIGEEAFKITCDELVKAGLGDEAGATYARVYDVLGRYASGTGMISKIYLLTLKTLQRQRPFPNSTILAYTAIL